MSKAPSDATKLRTAMREISQLRGYLVTAERQRDAYRARATQAEQQVAEWKSRFDALLLRTPREQP